MIGSVLQELIEEVTIGPMDFDAVKTSLFRVLGSFAEGFNDARDFGCLKRARASHIPLLDVLGSRGRQAGSHWEQPEVYLPESVGPRCAPHARVCKNPAPCLVNRIRHELPGFDLVWRPNPGTFA